MVKYLVLGAGIQGIAIVKTLRTIDPDATVFVQDSDSARFTDDAGMLSRPGGADRIVLGDVPGRIPDEDWDCVVSALPYHLNVDAAQHCADKGWRWLDLGGDYQSSEKVREIYEGVAACCTDFGLAPGLVGTLGWWFSQTTRRSEPKNVELFCGGLPLPIPKNRFKYAPTFSPEGLINEYLNSSHILEDGEIAEIDGCFVVNTSVQWETETLEAFYTSGGVDPDYFEAMMDRGIDNVSYRTLRYKGHVDEVKHLLSCGLTASQLRAAIAAIAPPLNDFVAIEIRLTYETGMVAYQFEIPQRNGMSAMQRGTAFPAAVAAHIIARGDFDGLERENVTSRSFATDDFFGRLFALKLWKGKENHKGWVRMTETSW
jgi:saccharopine dehydrogenase-like NADP-dependent oxidoreductase